MTEHSPEYGPRHVWGSYVSTNSVNERPIGRYTDTEFAPRQSSRATAPLPATGTGAIGLATA